VRCRVSLCEYAPAHRESNLFQNLSGRIFIDAGYFDAAPPSRYQLDNPTGLCAASHCGCVIRARVGRRPMNNSLVDRRHQKRAGPVSPSACESTLTSRLLAMLIDCHQQIVNKSLRAILTSVRCHSLKELSTISTDMITDC
jgi:hypothetical protein